MSHLARQSLEAQVQVENAPTPVKEMAGVHLRPEANDLGGAALALPPNPELENAEEGYGSIGPCIWGHAAAREQN